MMNMRVNAKLMAASAWSGLLILRRTKLMKPKATYAKSGHTHWKTRRRGASSTT